MILNRVCDVNYEAHPNRYEIMILIKGRCLAALFYHRGTEMNNVGGPTGAPRRVGGDYIFPTRIVSGAPA